MGSSGVGSSGVGYGVGSSVVSAEGYMIGDEEELHSDVEMDAEDYDYDHGASEHKEQGLGPGFEPGSGPGLASGPGLGLGYTLLLESKTSSVDHATALLLHAEVSSE